MILRVVFKLLDGKTIFDYENISLDYGYTYNDLQQQVEAFLGKYKLT